MSTSTSARGTRSISTSKSNYNPNEELSCKHINVTYEDNHFVCMQCALVLTDFEIGSRSSTKSNEHGCKHINVTFLYEDNHFVCTQCALVLTDYAYCDRQDIPEYKIKPKQWAEVYERTQNEKSKSLPTYFSRFGSDDSLGQEGVSNGRKQFDLDVLERVCGNFFIPKTVEEKVRYSLSRKDFQDKRNGRKMTDNALIAYALYSACLLEDCARTPEVICSYFQIEVRYFWTIANKFSYSPRKVLPSDILKSMRGRGDIACLNDLSYKDLQKITQVSDNVSNELSHSPRVILAAVLHIFLNDTQSKCGRVCVREIAKACDVCVTSVIALKKVLSKMNIFSQNV